MDIEPSIFETGRQSAYPYTMQPDQSKVDGSGSKFTVYKAMTYYTKTVNNKNHQNNKKTPRMDIEPAIFETGSQSAFPYTMQPDQSRIDVGEDKFTVY